MKDEVEPPALYAEMQYKHFNVKGGYDYINGHYNAAEINLSKAIEYHEKEDKSELINTYVDLADVLRLNNKPKEAKEIFEILINHFSQMEWNDFPSKYRWAQVLRRGALVFENENPAQAMNMSQEAYQLLLESCG